MATYGSSLAKLAVGISVGSEDLYRVSPTGVANSAGVGAQPADIINYIKQVRDVLAGTPLSGVSVGHVDTWTAWVDGGNQGVINACDFIGVDAYPYFQNTMANGISNGKKLMDDAVSATQAAVGGKPVWITETGFPVSGKTSGDATPSLADAKTYWDQVGCPLFGKTNVWWYTLQDSAPDTPNPSFGIVGSALTTTPLYDLSCNGVDTGSASSSPSSAASSSGSSSAPASSGAPASSQSAASGSSSAAPTVGGGSPGEGAGLPSSQLSLETATATATGAASSPSKTGGSESGSGNATAVSTGKPSAAPTAATSSAAGVAALGSFSAGFVAILTAMLLL